jgi:hypothetical protein
MNKNKIKRIGDAGSSVIVTQKAEIRRITV